MCLPAKSQIFKGSIEAVGKDGKVIRDRVLEGSHVTLVCTYPLIQDRKNADVVIEGTANYRGAIEEKVGCQCLGLVPIARL